MKFLRAALFAGIAASATAAGASDGFRLSDLLPRAFQTNPRVDLTVITEATPEGRKLTPATRDHPVYYVGADGGLLEAGDLIAGERPPPSSVLHRKMVEALELNGYLPADDAHPPTLDLYFRWGSFNKLSQSLSSDGSMDDLQRLNLVERAGLVGGTRFALDVALALNNGTLPLLEARNPNLMSQTRDNLYFVIVSAYDLEAAKHRQIKLLWRTKMSTNSQGLEMDETVPLLVVTAAPYFGREMAQAEAMQARIGEGEVKVGEPVVKGVVDLPSRKKPRR